MFGAVRRTRRAWAPAIAVFVTGTLLAALATYLASQSAREARRRTTAIETLRLSSDLESVVLSHAALLSALRSLHRVSEPLSRTEFHEFVTTGRLLAQHPGAQALEFARRVRDSAAFEAGLRGDDALHALNYPDYPGRSTEGDQWIVDYLAPVEGNEAAFGVDLGAEPRRRAAIDAACATAAPVATAPVRLVQERGTSVGLVVFAPVYEGGEVPASTGERDQRCAGLMIVVYRADDMLAAVRRDDRRGFELYDAGPVSEAEREETETLVFDTDNRRNTGGGGELFTFHRRRWRIALDASSAAGWLLPTVATGAVGLAFTAVVSGLVLELATFRRRALARGRVAAAGDRDRRTSNGISTTALSSACSR